LALGKVSAKGAEDRGAVAAGSRNGVKAVGAKGPKGAAHVESGGDEDKPSVRKLLSHGGCVFPSVAGAGEPADPLPRDSQSLGGLGHEGDSASHESFPAHKPKFRPPTQSPKEPDSFDQTVEGSGGQTT